MLITGSNEGKEARMIGNCIDVQGAKVWPKAENRVGLIITEG